MSVSASAGFNSFGEAFMGFSLYESLPGDTGADILNPVSVFLGSPAPEPTTASTILLGALGITGLAAWRRRQAAKTT